MTEEKPITPTTNYAGYWNKIETMPYALEKKLIKKLDVMIRRCTQPAPSKDAVLQCHGSEGEGKSNSAVAVAGYIKKETKRDIHMFFRLEPLIEFSKMTEKKIIIWDEPSLDSLSSDQLKEVNKNLLRLFMTIRKRRHFFIINFTKFWKFPEYMTVDRSLGMIHMYSRKEIEPGRFRYIRKHKLEELYNDYMKRKQRNFRKLSSFGGKFPEVLNKYYDKMDITVNGIAHSTLKDYEHEKDLAIESIGEKKVNQDRIDLRLFKKKVAKLKCPIKSHRELWKQLGVTKSSFYEWAKFEHESENNPKK